MAVGAAIGELFVKLGLKTTLKSDLEKEKNAAATASAGIQAAIGSATGKTITVKSKVAETLQTDYSKAKTVLTGFENFYKTHQGKINAIAAGFTAIGAGAVALDQKYRVLSNTAEQNAYLMGISADENTKFIQSAAGAKGDIEGALAIQTQFIRAGITDGEVILKNTKSIRELSKVTGTDMVTSFSAMHDMMESTGEPLDKMTEKIPLFYAAWRNDIDMSEVSTMISRNSVAIRNSGLSVDDVISRLVALREEGYRGRSLYTNFNKVLEDFNARDENAAAATARMTELQKNYNDTVEESKQLTADYNKDLEDLQTDSASKIAAIRADSHKDTIQKNNEVSRIESDTVDKIEELTKKYKKSYQEKIDAGKNYQLEYEKQAKIIKSGTSGIDEFIRKTFEKYNSDDAAKVTDDLNAYRDEYDKLVKLREDDATAAERITGEINKQSLGIESINKGLADTLGIIGAISAIPLVSTVLGSAVGAGLLAKLFGWGAGTAGAAAASQTALTEFAGTGVEAGAGAEAAAGGFATLSNVMLTLIPRLAAVLGPLLLVGHTASDTKVDSSQWKVLGESAKPAIESSFKEVGKQVAPRIAESVNKDISSEIKKKDSSYLAAGQSVGDTFSKGLKSGLDSSLPGIAVGIEKDLNKKVEVKPKIVYRSPGDEDPEEVARRAAQSPIVSIVSSSLKSRRSSEITDAEYEQAVRYDIERAERLAKQATPISSAATPKEPYAIVSIQNVNVQQIQDTGKTVAQMVSDLKKGLKPKGYGPVIAG